MKRAGFEDGDGVFVGSVDDDGCHLVNPGAALARDPRFGSMQALIEGGPAAWDHEL